MNKEKFLMEMQELSVKFNPAIGFSGASTISNAMTKLHDDYVESIRLELKQSASNEELVRNLRENCVSTAVKLVCSPEPKYTNDDIVNIAERLFDYIRNGVILTTDH